MHDVHPYTVCTCREMYITRQSSVTCNRLLSTYSNRQYRVFYVYSDIGHTDTDGGGIIKLTIIHIQGVNPKLEYEYIIMYV